MAERHEEDKREMELQQLLLLMPPAEEQRAIICSLESDTTEESLHVYTVSQAWYDRWRAFVGLDLVAQQSSDTDKEVAGGSSASLDATVVYSPSNRTTTDHCATKAAITGKIKHAIKHKTISPARLAQLLQPSLAFCFSLQPIAAYRPGLDGAIGCKLKQNANKGCNSCATVVQQLCKSRRTCFMFYCMFYFTCDRSLNQQRLRNDRRAAKLAAVDMEENRRQGTGRLHCLDRLKWI